MIPEPEPDNTQRVEAYLDQLLVPLGRKLSAFHREELRRELWAHLWGRIDAYRELGQSETDAVTEALKQFGGAKDFTRQWQREWLKMPSPLTLSDVHQAGKSALKPTLAGITAAFLPCLLLHMGFTNLEGTAAGTLLYKFADIVVWGWFMFAFFLMPLSVGVKQGQRTPAHAGIGMLTALIVEFVVSSLLDEYVGWILPNWVWSSPIASYIQTDSGVFLTMLAAWIPVAGGAAAVSGWWTERRRRVTA